MKQAIITKYIGPKVTKAARIRAFAFAGVRFFPYKHELSVMQNHELAAEKFMAAMAWDQADCIIGCGSMPDDSGYCFVLSEKPLSQRQFRQSGAQ